MKEEYKQKSRQKISNGKEPVFSTAPKVRTPGSSIGGLAAGGSLRLLVDYLLPKPNAPPSHLHSVPTAMKIVGTAGRSVQPSVDGVHGKPPLSPKRHLAPTNRAEDVLEGAVNLGSASRAKA